MVVPMIQSIEDGRKEAGQQSIADKIINRLYDLEKTVENNQGRWAWELLQNAKDSISEEDDRTVSIQIELDASSVTFRHNGTHFSSQDVIGLIDQMSSKRLEEGQKTKKTGRFGTGFLTTHLLSRVIKIEGIIESADKRFDKFEFLLDRRSNTVSRLIPQIANSWNDFNNSIEAIGSTYDESQYNTSFCYQLDTEKQRGIAQVGISEFSKLIPFVLSFVSKIGRVEIIDRNSGNTTSYEKNREFEDDFIVHILKTSNDEKEDVLILHASNEKVDIATEIEKCQKGYIIKGIEDFPKLFCDFPLIGTENFHLPVIVNSFFFNPLRERHGIWLKDVNDLDVIENQELLKTAIELYKALISKISQDNFFHLYNIVETRIPSVDSEYFDKNWYQEFIQNPIREYVLNAEIVELEDKTSTKRAIKDLNFPKTSFPERIRDEVWQFIFDLSPNTVCKKLHLHSWCGLAWENWETIDYQKLVDGVSRRKNIKTLSADLKRDESSTFEWLNSLSHFLLEEDSNLILLQKNLITPNQNGQFKKIVELYIDSIRDDELVYILELLGEDWKNILLHENIDFAGDSVKEKEKKDIAAKITENLNRELKTPSHSQNPNLVKTISLLSEWFGNNPQEGKDMFPEIYRKRAEIFMNTIRDKESLYKVMRTCTDLNRLAKVAQAIEDDSEIIEKIQGVQEMNGLLEEFKADHISELKTMLRIAQGVLADDSNKIEITQEILLSLGVTSVEDLEAALKDKNIAAKFVHTSTPTVAMFITVQNLIKRAKDNVIKHLKSLENYNCDDMEELAGTVIGGVRKDGFPIYIVVRPSDNGEVIIYYSSEKDILDDPSSELWIDNGSDDPKCLTLGKVLKTTGINRIPVN
jgi:hypothetical protein